MFLLLLLPVILLLGQGGEIIIFKGQWQHQADQTEEYVSCGLGDARSLCKKCHRKKKEEKGENRVIPFKSIEANELIKV